MGDVCWWRVDGARDIGLQIWSFCDADVATNSDENGCDRLGQFQASRRLVDAAVLQSTELNSVERGECLRN
jgi:hypothetical protein